jgi:hypothetical protein
VVPPPDVQRDVSRFYCIRPVLSSVYGVPAERFRLAHIPLHALTSSSKQPRPRYHRSSADGPPDEITVETNEPQVGVARLEMRLMWDGELMPCRSCRRHLLTARSDGLMLACTQITANTQSQGR